MGTGVTRVVRAADVVSEADFQATLVEVAHARGWLVYHTWSSKHSAKGFPDLVMLREDREVIAELKRVGRKPDKDQQRWLDAFRAAGRETFLWTPDDWDEIHGVLT